MDGNETDQIEGLREAIDTLDKEVSDFKTGVFKRLDQIAKAIEELTATIHSQ